MNSSISTSKPVIAIAGPTASGKSELGIELALRVGGEIINCDSVQVYREIEIATAKVPLAERRGVPHHLIDFVPPTVTYTAGDWARAAATKIEEIEARGHVPILVGGTGFYLRAFRQPFFVGPATDEVLRSRLTRIRERHGPLHLHKLLEHIDPQTASTFNSRDWPRVQRAIEVRIQTGRPLTSQLTKRPAPHESASRMRVFVLNPPRAELYERINRRTDAHFAAGLVQEVQRLLEQGVPYDSNALGAHGYRRVVEHLRGERDLAGAINQTKLDVRHYSKRQLTWFRREPDVEWLDGFGEDPAVRNELFRRLNVT